MVRLCVFLLLVLAGPFSAALSILPGAGSNANAAAGPLKFAQADPAPSLNLRNRKRVQRALKALGHDVGAIDGTFGAETRAAIGAFQKSLGEDSNGELSTRQLEALFAAARKLQAERPKAAKESSDPVASFDATAIHAVVERIVENYTAAEQSDRGTSERLARDEAIAAELLSSDARAPDAEASYTTREKSELQPTDVFHAGQRARPLSARTGAPSDGLGQTRPCAFGPCAREGQVSE